MATGDISRNAFDPGKHYAGVRMQQGRVITEDDWNENERIEDEDRRCARGDIIGPAGTPDNGFLIYHPEIIGNTIDFKIHPGSFYLGGLRLVMEKMEEIETFLTQRDWLQQPDNLYEVPPTTTPERFDLVYLEAWQQPVSAVEDKELFEVAIGGPDTSTRMRTMRRVRVEPGVPDNCSEAWDRLKIIWENEFKGTLNHRNERVPDVTLSVSFSEDGSGEDLCKPNVHGGYLGAENQAIRVQLVDRTHITWGFDNASPLYRVKVTGSEVTMVTEPKDQAHWPLSGQVVEILPRSAVLPNDEKIAEIKGELFNVNKSYNPVDGKLTISGTLSSKFNNEREDANEEKYFFMRVWNRGSDIPSKPMIEFSTGQPIALGNTGLLVTIKGRDRNPGDYWIIAARPETPKKVVPWKLEKGIPPNGIRRFYAPLAIIHWQEKSKKMQGRVIHDCRKRFRSLTELQGCCTVTVGARGDFNKIQEAVNYLSGTRGGEICILPGIYAENVKIDNARNITISGCGENTIVHPDPGSSTDPIFLIKGSLNIRLESMTLVTATGTAIQVNHIKGTRTNDSRGISVMHNLIIAHEHAVEIRVDSSISGGNAIHISYNQIGMLDKPNGKTAIFCSADDVLIQQNRMVTVPAPKEQDPQVLYNKDFIQSLAAKTFPYVSSASNRFPKASETQGGIQIAGGSDHVKIVDNLIMGGTGNGISFGAEGEPGDFIYEVTIERNRIMGMHLSGIGPANYSVLHKKNKYSDILDFQKKESNLLEVWNLSICGNIIEYCSYKRPGRSNNPYNIDEDSPIGGIVLDHVEKAIIRENRIENNGSTHVDPVCGIYILFGENIDISANRIVGNGRLKDFTEKPKKGTRGGIVIDKCLAFDYLGVLTGDIPGSPGEFGLPALKVHNNIVNQPLGRALSVVALGPVSVVNNQFTTQDIDFQLNLFDILAGAVLIFNLGIAQNFIWLLLPSTKNMARIRFDNPQSYQDPLTSNIMKGPGFPFMQQPGSFDLTKNVGTVSGRLKEIFFQLLSFYLSGGNVMFHNNQTVLDLRSHEITSLINSDLKLKIDYAFSSQFIFSLDDVSFIGNQSECKFFVDFLFANTSIIAAWARTSNNCFKEGLVFSLFSLFSMAFMNTVTNNQATRCLKALGAYQKHEQGNIILFDQLCQNVYDFINQEYGYLKAAPQQVQEESIDFTSVKNNMDYSFKYIDRIRLGEMKHLKFLFSDRRTVFEQQKEILSGKYGPDDPRVIEMESKLEFNDMFVKGLDFEIDKASFKYEPFDKNTWMVCGRVLNKDFKGSKGLTVSFYDNQERWINRLGYTCTDERGFYSLVYPSETIRKQQLREDRELFLTVSDKQNHILHRESEPLFVKIGQIDTRMIVITDQDGTCTPPGPEPDQEKPGPGQEQTGPEQEQRQTGPTQDKEQWIVEGTVKDEKNRPIKDVKVRLYDEKHLHDDRLGEGVTNEEGKFKFIFKGDDFQALMKAKTDIYLEVVDDKDEALYTSPQALRCQPGGVDTFDILVPTKTKKQRKQKR